MAKEHERSGDFRPHAAYPLERPSLVSTGYLVRTYGEAIMIVNDPKVGDYVYRACKPLRPGIIRTVDGKDFGGYFTCIHVQWLDGQVSAETTAGLKDFNALIADHRKKLATHETSLMRLKSLQNKIRTVTPEETRASDLCPNCGIGKLAYCPQGEYCTREVVRNYIKQEQFIHAIKHVRDVTSMGLKEAKDMCDKLRSDMGWNGKFGTASHFSNP
jgi:ribosomal protein L7/L12